MTLQVNCKSSSGVDNNEGNEIDFWKKVKKMGKHSFLQKRTRKQYLLFF